MVRQVSEKQVHCSTEGTDINFGSFEETLIQAIARANQIPSESLKLAVPRRDSIASLYGVADQARPAW